LILFIYYLISLSNSINRVIIIVSKTFSTSLYKILIKEYPKYLITRVFREFIDLIKFLSYSLLSSYFFNISSSNLFNILIILVNLDNLDKL